MKALRAACFALSFGLLASPDVVAQSADVVTSAQAYGLNPPTAQAAPHMLPYTVIRETHRTSTLADGTHIEMDPVKARIYQDSSGRQRQEFYVKVRHDGVVTEELNAISDLALPKPRSTAAPSETGPTPAAIAVSDTAPVVMPKVERRVEDLGTKTDIGMTLVGKRFTSTYPTGSIGNDRDIVVTQTTWRSEELQLDMLIQSHDPRIGDTTTQVEVLSRDEPDPSLFLIPADYQIIEVPAHD
jgi:hypothetical protein